ncbi:GTP-binding protein rhb1 [Daldinia childiae]|uniref:GTP-binding protein rhb1 n=1 Tax=Daldinia childiae TaxID=326645 RepID=UPI0014454F08|nr:GTP-binding protein rhb1 [Daldinia childiae]KAF3065243.1 GTP-binding protein rhb1 [Daldinia childiae]
MPSPSKQRKVAIVGSRSANLPWRYSSSTATSSRATIPPSRIPLARSFDLRVRTMLLKIVDTAGQDEYSILNSKHFIGIHGYMLVYSVSSLPSFEMVQVIREKILNHLGTDWVPIVIVGNKSDLRPEQRQVSQEDGKKLAEKFNCGWTEASARYNENVGKAFELLIAQVEKSQNPNEATNEGKCQMM